MKIIGIDHYSIWVKDLKISIEFYTNILKLKPIKRPDFDFPGAWFGLGEQQLHLISGRNNEIVAGSRRNHLAIEIDSVNMAHAELKGHECIVNPPKLRPDGYWQLFIVDPDGYYIELTSIPNT